MPLYAQSRRAANATFLRHQRRHDDLIYLPLAEKGSSVQTFPLRTSFIPLPLLIHSHSQPLMSAYLLYSRDTYERAPISSLVRVVTFCITLMRRATSRTGDFAIRVPSFQTATCRSLLHVA